MLPIAVHGRTNPWFIVKADIFINGGTASMIFGQVSPFLPEGVVTGNSRMDFLAIIVPGNSTLLGR